MSERESDGSTRDETDDGEVTAADETTADGEETIVLPGRSVVGGRAEAEALVTDETISGWGGVNPYNGTIIETRHELAGECFTDKVLVFRGAKGSSGWSSIFHTTRLAETAPAAMVYAETTTKVALGAVVTRAPAVTDLDRDPTEVIETGDRVVVDGDAGTVTVTKRAGDEGADSAADDAAADDAASD